MPKRVDATRRVEPSPWPPHQPFAAGGHDLTPPPDELTGVIDRDRGAVQRCLGSLNQTHDQMYAVVGGNASQLVDLRARHLDSFAAIREELLPTAAAAFADHRPEPGTPRVPAKECLREHEQLPAVPRGIPRELPHTRHRCRSI